MEQRTCTDRYRKCKSASSKSTTTTSTQQQRIIERMRDTGGSRILCLQRAWHELSAEYVASLNKTANKLWKGIDKNTPAGQLWADTVLDSESTSGRLKLGTTLYTVYQRLFTPAKAPLRRGQIFIKCSVVLYLKSALINLNQDYYNDQTPEWGNW